VRAVSRCGRYSTRGLYEQEAHTEKLADLEASLRVNGLIQPVTVRPSPSGAGYELIAGERRWRASRLAGLKDVPVRIIETSPQGMLEMAIVENVQRTDLNPIDRANSFDRLVREFNLGNSDICQRIGKSPAFVSNTLRLLELPDALKAMWDFSCIQINIKKPLCNFI